MTEPEPYYEYVKGQGWVPQFMAFIIREYEGRKYLVYAEVRASGKVYKGERTFSGGPSRGIDYALKHVTWFGEYYGTPAGFGGAFGADQSFTQPVVIIHTVPL